MSSARALRQSGRRPETSHTALRNHISTFSGDNVSLDNLTISLSSHPAFSNRSGILVSYHGYPCTRIAPSTDTHLWVLFCRQGSAHLVGQFGLAVFSRSQTQSHFENCRSVVCSVVRLEGHLHIYIKWIEYTIWIDELAT